MFDPVKPYLIVDPMIIRFSFWSDFKNNGFYFSLRLFKFICCLSINVKSLKEDISFLCAFFLHQTS